MNRKSIEDMLKLFREANDKDKMARALMEVVRLFEPELIQGEK